MKLMLALFSILFFWRIHYCSADNKDTRPNILIINVDDMGWRDVGFMGSEYYETPTIDGLAANGVIFTNAYTAASNCAPSRASMMSGQWTPRHGIYTVGSSERGKAVNRKLIPEPNNDYISKDNLLLPLVLQNAGYVTCHAGKWHLSDNPSDFGFELNIGGSHAGNPGSYYPPYKNVPSLTAKNKNEYLTNRIMDEVVQFVDTLSSNSPFFLYYSPYAVHTPIQPVELLVEKYKNKKPWNGQENYKYATMVENLDFQIKRLIKKLNEKEYLENTCILFTSDNGGVYNITKQWPLRAGKGSYYEGGIRVPMFIYWKGYVDAGLKTEIPVSNLDFYPTILQVAGIKKPDDKILDGTSLIPVILNNENPQRALYWHFPIYLEGGNKETQDIKYRTRPGSAVREGDWKLIQYFENNELELYNLSSDLGEKNNLADSNPDKVQELLSKLDTWRKMVNAPVPSNLNPDFKE